MKLRPQSTRRSKTPGGYTLLEMMLAVSIVVIIASLASHPVMRTFRDNRLGEAGEDVRIVLAGTRLQAIDRDEDWQFRYEPGGTHYVRVPWTQSATTSAAPASGGGGRMSGTLPEGIQFSAAEAAGGELASELVSGLPDEGELSGLSWSAPIVFFPDGTATSASFEITDQYAGIRDVSVRDLTGAVSVKRPSVLSAN